MTDNDVFVKRVEFEENNNEPPAIVPIRSLGETQSDVEKLTEPKENGGCMIKFCVLIDKLGVKSALSHIGLLLSLGLFCYGGGWVRMARRTLKTEMSKKKTQILYLNSEKIHKTVVCNAMLFITKYKACACLPK